MKKKLTFIQILAAAAITAGAMSTAHAGIFLRTRVVVAPAVVAPVAVAPVAVTPVVAAPVVTAPVVAAPVAPVVAAPVVAAPVVAAPVAVTPVYVPTCRLVAVPVVNTWTGATYMVTRRVCN